MVSIFKENMLKKGSAEVQRYLQTGFPAALLWQDRLLQCLRETRKDTSSAFEKRERDRVGRASRSLPELGSLVQKSDDAQNGPGKGGFSGH